MGANGISRIVKKFASKGIKTRSYSYFDGKKIAIDTMLIIYKFLISSLNSDVVDPKIHIRGILNKIKNMLSNGIFPIFVMDGKSPNVKETTIQKRKQEKKIAEEQLIKSKSDSDKRKWKKRTVKITSSVITDIKKLLELLGLPMIQANGEADPQCVALNISNRVYGVVSEDMDTLVFGADKMIRNFSNRNEIKEYNLEVILKNLNLTYEQFVELAIILGCDYCPPLNCIKWKNAYEIYINFKSIDKLLEYLKNENKKNIDGGLSIKYFISSEFENKWKIAKNYYLNVKVYNPSSIDLNWKMPKYDELYNFLVNVNKFDSIYVNNLINDIRSVYDYYKIYGVVNGNYFKRRTYVKKYNKPILQRNMIYS